MARARTLGITVLGLAALALGACGDDEADPVSQAAYDETAAELCERQGGEQFQSLAAFRTTARSDAEQVALFRSEFVPRVRAIVRGINAAGYPPDREADYRAALGSAMSAAQEIEDDTYELIDRQRRGALPDDENPFLRIDAAFADADVPC
jgi:hypothetical protein